jgi:hypothetical protein
MIFPTFLEVDTMIPKALVLLSLSTAFWATGAFANPGGSCHFHGNKPAAEATVSACAVQRKEALVKSGKLDAAWRAVKPGKIETVEGKKGKEWQVVFVDPSAKDKAKETLYMFFTPPGNFIAANFTGQ